MRASQVITLLGVASTALATNTFYLNNQCSFAVYYAQDGGSVNTVAPNSTLSSVLGNSNNQYIDISNAQSNGAVTSPMRLAYSITDGTMDYYDLAFQLGDPFQGDNFVVTPSESTCGSIPCQAGVRPCPCTYEEDGSDPNSCAVKECDATADLTLATCTQ